MKRNIPLKNYIVLLLIIFLTIVLLVYLTNVYNKKRDYDESKNIRMSFLKIMQEDDFENFITENQEFVLYISNSDNQNIVDFEKDMKKLVIKKGYDKEMIYLNSKNLSDKFIETIKNYFSDSLKKENIKLLPNVLIIKNGKISNILYVSSITNAQDVIDCIEKTFYGRIWLI